MTASTIEGALAEEAARRDDRDARIRAEGFRAGAEAMREKVATQLRRAGMPSMSAVILSLDIPEDTNG